MSTASSSSWLSTVPGQGQGQGQSAFPAYGTSPFGQMSYGIQPGVVSPSLPKWIPSANALTGELSSAYNSAGSAYDPSEYDKAFENIKGNLLTQSNQSANAAAQEYINRARQSGGATEGAGLIKAEGQVAGRRAVGEMELEKAKYDISQRTQANQMQFQIADSLAKLRSSYLNSLLNFVQPGYSAAWNTLDTLKR